MATDNTETNISGATASTHTLVAADQGTTIKVTVSFTDDASNAETLTSTATAAVAAAPNTLPLASNGTVTTNEDTAHTFAASEFSFSDADPGDTLESVEIITLPASGTGTLALSGTPVTAGQEIAEADIGTLTYTPPANANGTGYASFTFKVSDGTAESAAAYTMTITVTAVNDAPTVANTIPDRSATAGTAFSYAFPANTFSDADTGDTLTYAATKADGATLPTWLSFAAGTRTFSGTPQTADVGTVSVKVTASDGNGGSGSDDFDIMVSGVEHPRDGGADDHRHGAGRADADGGHHRHHGCRRADHPRLHVPVDPGGHRQHRDEHRLGDGEHLHAGGGRPGHDDQGDGELHRRSQQPRDADQRGDGGRLGGGQHPRDGGADDHRHGAGRADADGGHHRHRGCRRADQRQLHVPVDPDRCRRGYEHLRGDGEHLHAGDGRPGHDDQGDGELHRRRQQPRDAHQRGDGGRLGGAEHPRDGRADDHRHGAGRADADGGHHRHRGCRRADQRQLRVPVDPGGHRQQRDEHRLGDGEHLHAGDGRPGHDDQGEGELHRRRQQRRDADQQRVCDHRSAG